MAAADLALAQIRTSFDGFHVEKSRGGYTLYDRGNGKPIARLRPTTESGRFELFYWSAVRGGWRTFGNMGRMRLTLDDAHQIVEADPMFQIYRTR
jgi:hypothetical protein